jgi:hypothetical protein
MTILKKVIRSQYFDQLMGIFVACLLILFGIAALLKGDLGYRNYWGGLVFAPFAIAIGIFLLSAVFFRWRKFSHKPVRFKGRAARKARRAARYKSTIDEFDKPWRGGA